jgi:hypothetical protein
MTTASKSSRKPSKSHSGAARAKRGSGKRELIAPNGDKRYLRRDSHGRIRESDDVGRSLARDIRQHAKTSVKAGQGDRGDQRKA